MAHNCYDYSKEELLASSKLPIAVMEDEAAVFHAMAVEMVSEIRRKNESGERTVFICPVGPVGQYPYFVDMVNREDISLKNVWFINMDEYLTAEKQWIDIDDRLSFRGFMSRFVYSQIRPELVMPENQRIFPCPGDEGAIQELIGRLGGVDICFGGIGINGHVAFNEPQSGMPAEEFCGLSTRILKISPETRTVNSIVDLDGAVEAMPKYCITIGMKEILSARKIRLGCFRNWHRSVIRRAACGQASSQFPVTLLQGHPDLLIRITEFVASG